MKNFLFKYRSYTPIPFLIIILMYHQSNIWSIISGFIFVFVGELIRLWGVSWIGEKARSTVEFAEVNLIVKGPYAYVRNPLYIGNIIIYFGLGVMSFAIFPFVQIIAVLFFHLQYYLIINEEEKYLEKNFGTDYKKYLKSVHRFFPRLSKYKNYNTVDSQFNFKQGIKSEKRTLQAISFVSITIFLLWFFRRLSI